MLAQHERFKGTSLVSIHVDSRQLVSESIVLVEFGPKVTPAALTSQPVAPRAKPRFLVSGGHHLPYKMTVRCIHCFIAMHLRGAHIQDDVLAPLAWGADYAGPDLSSSQCSINCFRLLVSPVVLILLIIAFQAASIYLSGRQFDNSGDTWSILNIPMFNA